MPLAAGGVEIAAQATGRDPVAALRGGEDYELLAASRRSDSRRQRAVRGGSRRSS